VLILRALESKCENTWQRQCVAVCCCSVLQYVAMYCCSVLILRALESKSENTWQRQCVAVCCSVLQCVAMCCSVLILRVLESIKAKKPGGGSVSQRVVAVCCSVLQCVVAVG